MRLTRAGHGDRFLVLVKHALPVLDATRPAREWTLGAEGEAQAQQLAEQFRMYFPFRLVSSTEPKALRTCEIIATAVGVAMTSDDALRELDRPVLPMMSAADHERLNERVFMEVDTRVLGAESAREALDRFSGAVLGELRRSSAGNLVVVAHGTVISLFVAHHNRIDAFELWKRLGCSSFIVLDRGTLGLLDVVSGAAGSGN